METRAFLRGFLKGLAAPVTLFHAAPSPTFTAIAPVVVPARSDAEALAGDWRRIGDDLRHAMRRTASADS